MALIELTDISKIYGFGDATTLALDEVRLQINEGEFVAVMGPSGCGKSTLMHIIGMLDRPTQGEYLLAGQEVAQLHSAQAAHIRRDRIGFIFQSYNMVPRMTLLENVALPLLYKGWSQTKRLIAASNMLERVGLKEKEYYLPSRLSGGQTQCAAIARALVTDPKLIIADEPTGNLDSNGSRLVMELLGEVHRMGNTVLFVTHNPELTRYANRVIYMRDGCIVQDEKNVIGYVAPGAQKSMRTFHKTAEDDIAGVSTLLDALPQDKPAPRKAAKRRRTTKSGPRRTVRKVQ